MSAPHSITSRTWHRWSRLATVLALVLTAGLVSPSPRADASVLPHVGEAFEGITAPDQHGGMTTVDAVPGKVVVLHFCALWCVPCQQFTAGTTEMPSLSARIAALGDEGIDVEVVEVLVQGASGTASTQAEAERWSTEVVGDPSIIVLHAAGVPTSAVAQMGNEFLYVTGTMPTFAVVDAMGTIRTIGVGSDFDLEGAVRAATDPVAPSPEPAPPVDARDDGYGSPEQGVATSGEPWTADHTTAGGVLANDDANSGALLEASLIGTATGGTVDLAPDGTFTVIADHGVGEVRFDYRATRRDGVTDDAGVVVYFDLPPIVAVDDLLEVTRADPTVPPEEGLIANDLVRSDVFAFVSAADGSSIEVDSGAFSTTIMDGAITVDVHGGVQFDASRGVSLPVSFQYTLSTYHEDPAQRVTSTATVTLVAGTEPEPSDERDDRQDDRDETCTGKGRRKC